jgi:hypothetical protein
MLICFFFLFVKNTIPLLEHTYSLLIQKTSNFKLILLRINYCFKQYSIWKKPRSEFSSLCIHFKEILIRSDWYIYIYLWWKKHKWHLIKFIYPFTFSSNTHLQLDICANDQNVTIARACNFHIFQRVYRLSSLFKSLWSWR